MRYSWTFSSKTLVLFKFNPIFMFLSNKVIYVETIPFSVAIRAEGFFKGFVAQSRRNVPYAFKEMVGLEIILILVC